MFSPRSLSLGISLSRRTGLIVKLALVVIALAPIGAAIVGKLIGPGILHPTKNTYLRSDETEGMLRRTSGAKGDFDVRAPDGIELRGSKIRSRSPNGDWVLLFHGVSDNRTGVLGHAEFLLRHGYSIVTMDSRAHGTSGGARCTYGWKERYDTVAITNALYASESVRHLFALGVSMGAAVVLQSAAVEPRNRSRSRRKPIRESARSELRLRRPRVVCAVGKNALLSGYYYGYGFDRAGRRIQS